MQILAVTGNLAPGSMTPSEGAQAEHEQMHKGDKLLNSVIDGDTEILDDGKLINEAIDHSILSFHPDLLFENIVKNYKNAKDLYGERFLRELTGSSPGAIEKNVRIPEFRRELKNQIQERLKHLKKQDMIKKDGDLTKKAYRLAALVLYVEELDKLSPKGYLGEKIHKRVSVYGDKDDVRPYHRHDRFKDLSVTRSVKLAVRRGHNRLTEHDLRTHIRKSKGRIQIIYALDASGSMKGKKLGHCKKAGIALAFKAIERKDKVGLIVFGADVKKTIPPTLDFKRLLHEIVSVQASKETNIAKTIHHAVSVFPRTDATKHLVLITDAMPTVGTEPVKETSEAASHAAQSGISISVVGINLEKKSADLARSIAEIGNGKLYVAQKTKDIDKIILMDYEHVKQKL